MSEYLTEQPPSTERPRFCGYAVAITALGSASCKAGLKETEREAVADRARSGLELLRECSKCKFGRIEPENVGTDCPQGDPIAGIMGIRPKAEEV